MGDTVCAVRYVRTRLSSWCMLSQELLDLIFQRLPDFVDLYQCLHVSTHWQSTATDVILSTNYDPFLYCLKDDHHTEAVALALAGVSNNQRVAFSMTPTFFLRPPTQLINHTIHSSYRGWLLLHDDRDISNTSTNYNTNKHCTLYNPMTRHQIQLPPPPQVPLNAREAKRVHANINGKLVRVQFIEAPPEPDPNVFQTNIFVTSTSPKDPHCIVFALCLHLNLIAFCKPSTDTSFCKMRFSKPVGSIHDIIFHKGKLYFVSENGLLYVVQTEQDTICHVSNTQIPVTRNMVRQFYLVEEVGTGHLLLVERVFELLMLPQKYGRPPTFPWRRKQTIYFQIYKLRWKEDYGPTTWVKVTDAAAIFGDNQALVLASGDSMFVSVGPDHGNHYKPNCIYFMEKFVNSSPLEKLMAYDFQNQKMGQPTAAFKVNPSSPPTEDTQLVIKSDLQCRWFRFSTT